MNPHFFLVVSLPCPASLNANLQEGEAELGVERVNESKGVTRDLPMLSAHTRPSAVELTVSSSWPKLPNNVVK